MSVQYVTAENLDSLIADNDVLVIDFWAEWCAPCKAFGPVFEKLSDRFTDIVFAKCNTEEQREVAAAFGIRSIPTTAIFREKVLLFREAGALPEEALADILQKVQKLDMKEVHETIAKEQAKEESQGKEGEKGE
jgi:thioredoxin